MDQAQVQQLVAAALHEQSQQFQAELNILRSQRTPRCRLPDPDKFDGTFEHLETWYPEMKAKLKLDGVALGGTDEAKFWYVIGRLEKKPKSLVAPQITAAEKNQVFNHQSLFDQLRRLCNNPNAKKEAKRKLVSIKQYPDQAFNTFLATFEKFMFRSGADTWPDEARIVILWHALSDKLKRKLDLKDDDDVPDDDYDDFVATVQSLETGYDRSGGQHGGGHGTGTGAGIAVQQRKLWEPKPDPDAMQLSRIRRESTPYDEDSEDGMD